MILLIRLHWKELLYDAKTLAGIIINRDMSISRSQKFLDDVWEYEKEYLYAPFDGEDIALVLKHLHRAGIVVLLLVDAKQAASLNVQDDTYISGWLSDFANVDDVAGFIRKQSAIGDSVIRSRDFI